LQRRTLSVARLQIELKAFFMSRRDALNSTMTPRRWSDMGAFIVLFFALTGCGLGIASPTYGELDAGSSPDTGSGTAVKEPDGGSRPDAGGGESTDSTSASLVDAGDAGAGAPSIFGSPLCNVTGTTCKPDEKACFYAVPEGGVEPGTTPCTVAMNCEDASVATQQAACRVGVHSMPVCSTGLGPGGEGASCSQSSDCQAEFECVGRSAGTCKHYCCETACKGNEFCDIEPVFVLDADPQQSVPVCSSGPSCTPLGSGCAVGESCTIVNAAIGQTACVIPGPVGVGDACTTETCAVDLACISGTCRQLCNASSPSVCAGGSTCISLTALGNDGIGICDN
jgi:hypothetical protein